MLGPEGRLARDVGRPDAREATWKRRYNERRRFFRNFAVTPLSETIEGAARAH
jgi:hypothetical protein